LLRRLRLPFLFSSLAFLAYAIYAFVSALESDPALLHEVSVRYNPFDHTREEREAEERRTDLAYAARLRGDAYARIELADYDNAATRLDQAARYDREGERRLPEVRDARRAIADNRTAPRATRPGSPGADRGDPAP
jgi:hypothetical protein